MPSVKLNKKVVQGLKTAKHREDFWDKTLKGFIVRVYGNGKKNYEVIYRSELGRRARLNIGDANLMSFADARKKARKELGKVEDGEDPAQRKREVRLADTFNELADRYLEMHCRPKLKPRSVADIEYNLKSELRPAWGSWKASAVTRADIIDLLENIGVRRKAPVRANHVRAVITGIFNFAIQRSIIQTSPCVGLPRKYEEKPRSHTLSDDDIQALWLATEGEHPAVKDLFRVLLLLGQRSGETRQMQWEQINNGIWTIPAAATKNKQEHVVPIPKSVMTILEQHRKPDKPFVFSSRTGAGIKWLQKANYRILANMPSCRPWRVHDLRRTCATNLERMGIPDSVISAVLNHSKISRLGVTGRYTQHDFLDEKRKALERWCDKVMRLNDTKTKSTNVIPIKKTST